MQSMLLQTAQDSIRSVKDRARNYVDKSHRDINFIEGDMVDYLKIPAQSKTLKMGKCQNLSSRYYGPFKILKKIGDVAYRIKLSNVIKAHLVFHVNKLKRTMHPLENIVSPNLLLELIKQPSTPHELERILGFKDKCTRHSVYKEALVKWTNLEE